MRPETISDIEMARIKKIVMSMHTERKLEILTVLEDELFDARFDTLIQGFREAPKQYPLTLEEITREVEAVREKENEYGTWYQYMNQLLTWRTSERIRRMDFLQRNENRPIRKGFCSCKKEKS